MARNPGWKREPRRHELAAKGISSRRRTMVAQGMVEDRARFPESQIDYRDPEEIFVAFWIASLNNDFSNFDFSKAFAELGVRLRLRLSERAYLSFDDFKWYHTRGAWKEGHIPEDWEVLQSLSGIARLEACEGVEDRIAKPLDGVLRDVYDNIIETRYEYGVVDDHWLEMLSTYHDLQNPPQDLLDRVFLMDRIIHIEHDRGNIWGEEASIRVEPLREKVEMIYRRYRR